MCYIYFSYFILMNNYINRTAILIYINLSIAIVYGLEEFQITNFITNSITEYLEFGFIITMLLWNVSYIPHKRKITKQKLTKKKYLCETIAILTIVIK